MHVFIIHARSGTLLGVNYRSCLDSANKHIVVSSVSCAITLCLFWYWRFCLVPFSPIAPSSIIGSPFRWLLFILRYIRDGVTLAVLSIVFLPGWVHSCHYCLLINWACSWQWYWLMVAWLIVQLILLPFYWLVDYLAAIAVWWFIGWWYSWHCYCCQEVVGSVWWMKAGSTTTQGRTNIGS